MIRRSVVALLVMAGSVTGTVAATSTAGAAAAPAGLTSIPGVEVVTALPTPAPPTPEQAEAVSKFYLHAQENPTELAPPYLDARGEVVTQGVGAGSADLARQAVAVHRIPTDKVRISHRVVTRPMAALQRVAEEILKLPASELPDVESAWAVSYDAENNRVLVWTTKASPGMLEAIKARYGSDTVAVLHRPHVQRPQLRDSRYGDSPRFAGGAHIKCTTGFAYDRVVSGKTYSYMLTAGHCAPSGKTFYSTGTGQKVGSVTSGTRENWNTGTGTVKLSGQSKYLGDLALINTHDNGGSEAYIWRAGFWELHNKSPVVHTAFTHKGNRVCLSGAWSKETCGWIVKEVFMYGIDYGDGEFAQNVVYAEKVGGQCTVPGDSGGSIFATYSGAEVQAHGILSAGDGGGLDYKASSTEVCTMTFTDIWRSVDAWGGKVRLRPTGAIKV